jgi:polyphosphate kinase
MTALKDTETRNWLEIELEDDMDEELEQAVDDARVPPELRALLETRRKNTIDRHTYFNELLRLQSELVKLQDWVHY